MLLLVRSRNSILSRSTNSVKLITDSPLSHRYRRLISLRPPIPERAGIASLRFILSSSPVSQRSTSSSALWSCWDISDRHRIPVRSCIVFCSSRLLVWGKASRHSRSDTCMLPWFCLCPWPSPCILPWSERWFWSRMRSSITTITSGVQKELPSLLSNLRSSANAKRTLSSMFTPSVISIHLSSQASSLIRLGSYSDRSWSAWSKLNMISTGSAK